MAHEGLISSINEYLDNDISDGALFINGSWGSGKTYFIKNTLLPKYKTNEKKALFVSLNGKMTSAEIEKDLLAQLHPKRARFRSSRGYALASKTFESITFFNSINLNLANLLAMDESLKEQVALIIFDDLERCKMAMHEIFGCICDIMEKCSAKVIIIGNEKEIYSYSSPQELFHNRLIATLWKDEKAFESQKTANSTKEKLGLLVEGLSEPIYYSKIKEKTVWKTIGFDFDTDVFFDNILPKLASNDQESVEIIMKNKDILQSLFARYGCENLRIYRAATENYLSLRKLLQGLKSSYEKGDEYFEKVFMLSVFSSTLMDRCPIKRGIFDGEGLYVGGITIPDCKSIKLFVTNSGWNKEQFEKDFFEIEQMRKKSESDMPHVLVELREQWAYLSDEQVETRIFAMIKAFDDNQIDPKYFYLVYHYVFAYKNIFHFENSPDPADILKTILQKVKSVKKKIKIEDASMISMHFDEQTSPGIETIFSALEQKNSEISKEELNQNLNKPKALSFEELTNISNESLNNKCFMSRINVDLLIDTLDRASNENVDSIRELFLTVYKFSNISDFYQGDKESLINFKEKLATLRDNTGSKTKKKLLEWFVLNIDGIISRLR